MKKPYVQALLIGGTLFMLLGSIMRCQQRANAPEMKSVESVDSTEIVDSAMQAQTDRSYFEAVTKIADEGKVYAIDNDGNRSKEAFTSFDDYKQFIENNPQYPKNQFSYDSEGKPVNFNAKLLPNE